MLVPKYMPKPLYVHSNAISDLCQPVGGSYVMEPTSPVGWKPVLRHYLLQASGHLPFANYKVKVHGSKEI